MKVIVNFSTVYHVRLCRHVYWHTVIPVIQGDFSWNKKHGLGSSVLIKTEAHPSARRRPDWRPETGTGGCPEAAARNSTQARTTFFGPASGLRTQMKPFSRDPFSFRAACRAHQEGNYFIL